MIYIILIVAAIITGHVGWIIAAIALLLFLALLDV